jgi:small subunit ribosomal protein S17
MAKVLKGTVVSTKMQGTIVVEVTNRVPHPLYKKLLKRSKKYKVAPNGQEVKVGQEVKIVEARKVAKGKHFELLAQAKKEDK